MWLILTGSEFEPHAVSAGKPLILRSERAYGPAFYATIGLARNGGEDLRAVHILEAEISLRSNVSAAQLLALYKATGGTMQQYQLDKNNHNEAFQAYAQTLLLINHRPDYPRGFEITEEARQHELTAYRYLVFISYNKAVDGINSSHNSHLLQSPTYQGDRDLDLYRKYEPYTLGSLEQTIEQATICANLPMKRHFHRKEYRQTIEYCQMVKRTAGEFLSLERERLALLNKESCAQDIEQCPEYKEIGSKIVPLIKEINSETGRIWSQ